MPIEHTVAQGETTIGLADKFGHFAETVWNDPANAELKRKRENMNALQPGDRLVIPDLRPKAVAKMAEQKHRFRRKGIPAVFRLQVFDGEKPRANQNYRLTVDGRSLAGTTDANGCLEQFVPSGAREGQLEIGPDRFTLEIAFGGLDPLEEISGVQCRLNNLGYGCGDVTGAMNQATERALEKFQRRFGLTVNGTADAATRDKLRQVHDAEGAFPAPKN